MNIKAKLSTLNENDKIVYKNAIGAFLVKGMGLVISLFTMPAYIRYFEDQSVLGVWFTILSVLTWILNFDLGIGNGLRNKLTMALAVHDYKSAKELISSAYWMIGSIVILIVLVGNFLIPMGNWNIIFRIETDLIPEDQLTLVVRYVFFGIMLQFFLRLVSSILYALQKSAVNNFIALITSILLLVFALVAPCRTPVENLRMFAVAHIICANLPLAIASIYIFSKPLRDCRPSPQSFNKSKAQSVLSLGGIFFVCQILYMIIANTNEFFITWYTSPANVVEYQIYNKLFTLSGTLFMLALTPIWSAVSKAVAEQNFEWLQKLNRNISRLSFLAIACEFLLIPFLQLIINFWLREDAIQVNYGHAVCFALYGSAMLYQSGVSTITNGTGRIKIQAICYALGVLAKFLIIHIGIEITGSWSIVVLANALILIPYCVIQEIDLKRFLNRKIPLQDERK